WQLDVFFADVLRLLAQALFKLFAGGGDGGRVAAVARVEQAGIAAGRERGVDGQPDRAVLPRQAHGVLDTVGAARDGGDVFGVLARGQDLPQNAAELHFAQDAARLDTGQH